MQIVLFTMVLLALTACVAPGNSPTAFLEPTPPVTASRQAPPTSVPTRAAATATPRTTPIATPRASATTQTTPSLCSPLEDHSLEELSSILTNPFVAPRPDRDDGHHGADFSYYRRGERDSIEGVRVQAMLGGIVAAAIEDRIPYGNMVIVESRPEQIPTALQPLLPTEGGNSLYTLYAHMAAPPANLPGEEVACGQVLGAVGNSGWSGNPHLHLETRLGPPARTFEGMAFYDTGAREDEMEAYRLWRMSGEFQPLDPMGLIATSLEPYP